MSSPLVITPSLSMVKSFESSRIAILDLGIDIVIEETEVFVDREGVRKHIQAGAMKVLITTPGKGDVHTYVVGVNVDDYNPDEPIINNASCTTNCLMPFIKVLDQKFV